MKNPMPKILLVLVTLLIPWHLYASDVPDPQSIESAVSEAETLIKKGDFNRAAEAYQQAIDAGAVCASMYYNHGTAALKAGHLGPAVLSFERGLRLAPDDEDLHYNLHQALQQISGPLAAAAQMPRPQAWLLRWPLRLLQIGAIVVWTLALLFILLRLALMSRMRLLRGPGLIVSWLLFVFALALSLLSLDRQKIQSRGDAVMIAAQAQAAREADDAKAPLAFTVQPGQPVQIIERRADWMRVELLNGLQAWLPDSSLAEITPAAASAKNTL